MGPGPKGPAREVSNSFVEALLTGDTAAAESHLSGSAKFLHPALPGLARSMTDRTLASSAVREQRATGSSNHLRGRRVGGRPLTVFREDFYWKVLVVRDDGAWRISGWKDISTASRPIETVRSRSSTTG